MEGTMFQLRHFALRNAMYNIARQRWFDRWNRFFNLLTILGGTAVVAQIVKGYPGGSVATGLAIAVVGALQLVLDFGGRARTHQQLQREYTLVLAEMDGAETCDGTLCAKWRGAMTRISADEPPTMRALMTIADNQATAALCDTVQPRLHVPWQRGLTAQIFAQDGFSVSTNKGWQKLGE